MTTDQPQPEDTIPQQVHLENQNHEREIPPPRNYQNPRPAPPAPTPPPVLEGELNLSNTISHLLRNPLSIIIALKERKNISLLPILLVTLVSFSLFGLIVGSFSGGMQLWAAPLKITGGILFASIICLPSLYIFCCLSGIDVKIHTIASIQLCMIAITSLILTGFAPVLWLFSSSSNSAIFFGFLCLIIWFIALTIGLKMLTKTGTAFGMQHTRHLRLWAVIFTLVTLQMPTTLRPLISEPQPGEPLINFKEKKFFLNHWLDELQAENQYDNAQPSVRPQRGLDY